MAKPIGETPTLKSKSVQRFIRKKDNHQSKEKIAYWKKVNSQREVLF